MSRSKLASVNGAVVAAVLCLLITLGLALFSMFYPGWIRYTVTPPSAPSTQFQTGQDTRFIYQSRRRGLFFHVVDDVKSKVVQNNNGDNYFLVVYNYLGTLQTATPGFWSITSIMMASVGLHVAYMVVIGFAAWVSLFTGCDSVGRKLSYLASALIILGLSAGILALILFHIYLDMEQSSDVPALPDIYYYWSKELRTATSETLYICYGIYIASWGFALLALLVMLIIATSWTKKDKKAPVNMKPVLIPAVAHHNPIKYDHFDMVY